MEYQLKKLEKELQECKKRMIFLERRINRIEEKMDVIRGGREYTMQKREGFPQPAVWSEPVEPPKPSMGQLLGTSETATGQPMESPQPSTGQPLGTSETATGQPMEAPQPSTGQPLGTHEPAMGQPMGGPESAAGQPMEMQELTRSPQAGAQASSAEQTAFYLQGSVGQEQSEWKQTKPAGQSVPQRPVRPAALQASTGAESVIGRKIMGIVASTLIFISLILFATLLIPKLDDTAKLILMCVVSCAFTVFGLYKLSKDDKNALYLSITGCGLGAVYLSLFLSNLYFHVTNDVELYALLLVWASGVLYLSRKHSKVFQVIGNIGILISVLSGMILCIANSAPGKMVVLILYFIVGSLAFYLCHRSDPAASWVNHTFQAASLLFLIIGEFLMEDKILHYVGTILLVVFLIGMLINLISCLEQKNSIPSCVFGIFYSGELVLLEFLAVGNENARAILALLIMFAVLISLEVRVYSQEGALDDSLAIMMWTIVMVMIGAYAFVNVSVLADYAGFAVLAVPFVCYGFGKNRYIYKVMGMAAGYLLLQYQESTLMIPLIVQVGSLFVVLGVAFLGLSKKEGQYRTSFKIAWHLLLLCSIWSVIGRLNDQVLHWDEEIPAVVIFLLLALINTCMAKTRLGRSWETGEEEKASYVAACAVNALLMLYGTYKIGSADKEVLHILYILAALALFTVNVRNLLVQRKTYLDLYVAIKYTILLLVILSSFDAPDYMTSILLFVLAIMSVFIGFQFRIKTLRIYGLVLSLLCVVKLVMIDITYDNTLGRALSFFISGVLCFVISAIYYHAEHRVRKGEKPEMEMQDE